MQSDEKSSPTPDAELGSINSPSTRKSASPDAPEIKKTFKSQSLNSLFRRTSPERTIVAPVPGSPHTLGKSSPTGEKLTLAKTSPGNSQSTLVKTKGLSSSTGVFKLAAMKRDNSTSRNGTSSGSPSAAHSPLPDNSSVWKVPGTEQTSKETQNKPGDAPKEAEHDHVERVRERKKSTTEMSEEELAELGIFLTHRLEKDDDKSSRSFNWDDDDDVMDDAELAKLEGLSSLRDSARTVTPSSSKTGSKTPESTGPKLAPWHTSVPDQKSYVSIADQMKELAEKKHSQQQKQNTMKTNYKQNQIHGFHGARGGGNASFEDSFDGRFGSFDDAHFGHSRFDRGFHDMHNSAYKYTEHDKRYREFERPHPELYNTRSRQFEMVDPPREHEGFPSGRRYSREGPGIRDSSPRMGRSNSPSYRRRMSEDDNWRRGMGPEKQANPSDDQAKDSFSRRRPSVASSENSHGKALTESPPETSKVASKPSLEEQKEKMRQRLEAARKRKEEEQREERERLEAAQRRADALAKEAEEKHKKEREELLQEQKKKEEQRRKHKEEEEAKRKAKYVIPSKKTTESTDQRERAKSTTSTASIDDNTVRAVDKLVKTDDKEERLLSRSKVMNDSQKNWSTSSEVKSSRGASPSRLWGANQKGGAYIWGGTKEQKENPAEDDAPWNGDWRTARAEYKKEHPANGSSSGESRFFPKTNNPRIVLPSVNDDLTVERPKAGGQLPVPISPIVQSNSSTDKRVQLDKSLKAREKKVNLPKRKIEIPSDAMPMTLQSSAPEVLKLEEERNKINEPRVVLAKVSENKEQVPSRDIPGMSIPPITRFTSAYFEDVTGYMHRREYEQGNGPTPDYVMIRLPMKGESPNASKMMMNTRKYPRAKVVFMK